VNATPLDAFRQLDPRDKTYATRLVDLLLAEAQARGASDLHVQPTSAGFDLRWRLDGVLHLVGSVPRGETTDLVARLKVLAGLLTYRTESPQEGRIRQEGSGPEMRVSTFPTLHGERVVVRMFASSGRQHQLDDLGLPGEIRLRLGALLGETAGAIIVTGPAGSGKTTTAYACVRQIVSGSAVPRCVVTMEDPIEVALDGVAQSQVNPAAGFDLAQGLRSILRQDPEVVLVGEIRDRETAEGVFGAALTGHLVLTTFHAGSASGAISRLAEMGIEPYLLRSGLLAIVHQRLVRRLCDCATWTEDELERLGLPVARVRRAVGCPACAETGYRGRLVLAEMLEPKPTELGRAILNRDDAARIEALAKQAGLVPIAQRAQAAVEAGWTSALEVRRVLGLGLGTLAAGR